MNVQAHTGRLGVVLLAVLVVVTQSADIGQSLATAVEKNAARGLALTEFGRGGSEPIMQESGSSYPTVNVKWDLGRIKGKMDQAVKGAMDGAASMFPGLPSGAPCMKMSALVAAATCVVTMADMLL